MDNYVPLATKYRPQRFIDVIGQDMVVKMIIGGMRKNRLGSALLFSGTRGVGKTTIARILAKALRCENRQENDPEPCCKCESCLNFALDNQSDVIEMDAASNTSVDDIREVIESSRYRPAIGKFKIFIIDEVHMLSKSAFNALLKTLEEPPAHVKFLFATTETHKIPETVMSRVLKFDLKKMDNSLLSQYLSSICNQEKIIANSEVVTLIAKAAKGSVRDGLSILDQAINVSENNEITVSDIKNILYISDDSDIITLLSLIFSGNVKSTIEKYREIIRNNVSPGKMLNAMMDSVYILTCLRTQVNPPELSANLIHSLNELSEKVSLAALARIWQMLSKGAEELKFCEHSEIVLEMIIIRIAYASELPDLKELLKSYVKNTDITPVKNEKISDISNKTLAEEAIEMFPGAKIGKEQ
ncbi:MAG: DNA polymerase III subunit gamma/tau [Holosporaceae bacterium]|jgi:DNA polymerase-3 subunit gamma/tau|nr:DNA polymerase III subunit gamma/tau [Holosporaceae bacterium]